MTRPLLTSRSDSRRRLLTRSRDLEILAALQDIPCSDARVHSPRWAQGLGYVAQGTNDEHSGQTYRVKYLGDYVVVDVSYLARVPVLPPQLRSCRFAEPSWPSPVLHPGAGGGQGEGDNGAGCGSRPVRPFSTGQGDAGLVRRTSRGRLQSALAVPPIPSPRILRPAEALNRLAEPGADFTSRCSSRPTDGRKAGLQCDARKRVSMAGSSGRIVARRG